ncbi:MAG: hypothetical protein ACOCP8_04325 [archaeon]
MKYKNNSILTFQGSSFSKSLKLDPYNLSKLIIQLVTLSRDTHTAILKIRKNQLYLLQSNLIKGTHFIKISKEWLDKKIEKGDIIYQETKIRPKEKVYDIILDELNKNKIKYFKLGNYNIFGTLNQFFINVFNKSIYWRRYDKVNSDFIRKNDLSKKIKIPSYFCSEFVMYYFFNDKKAYFYSPYKVRKHFEKLKYKK